MLLSLLEQKLLTIKVWIATNSALFVFIVNKIDLETKFYDEFINAIRKLFTFTSWILPDTFSSISRPFIAFLSSFLAFKRKTLRMFKTCLTFGHEIPKDKLFHTNRHNKQRKTSHQWIYATNITLRNITKKQRSRQMMRAGRYRSVNICSPNNFQLHDVNRWFPEVLRE